MNKNIKIFKKNRKREKGKTFIKPCFIGMQKSHNVNIKNNVQETKRKKNNKAKVAAGASLPRT